MPILIKPDARQGFVKCKKGEKMKAEEVASIVKIKFQEEKKFIPVRDLLQFMAVVK